MSRKIKDVTDQKFGMLTATHISKRGSSGVETIWRCLCDCGEELDVKISYLTGGKKTHCGCNVKPRVDLTDKRFGRLVVKGLAPKSHRTGTMWECQCDCGNIKVVQHSDLGHRTNSCGCLAKDTIQTHNMSKTRPYKIYQNMLKRCFYSKDEYTYSNYGGRGITVSDEWLTFEGFWADMEIGYSSELELDRIDVNGNYCKENCRWVNKSLQGFNKRKESRNTSGKTGVSYYKSRNQWEAYITVDSKLIKLGYFNIFDDAVKAREEAELKYFGFNKE